MISLRVTMLVAALAATVGCTPPDMSSAQTVATDPTVQPGTATVPAAEAVRLFGEICGGSLPKFAAAADRAPGKWLRASTGTHFSQDIDASFRIVDGPASRLICSFVFATTDSQDAVQAALAARGKPAQTAFGFTVGFDQKAIAFINGSPRQHNGNSYYNLRMLSE